VDVEVVEQQSPLLGRQKVHDERSRAFALPRRAVDRSSWRDKAVRLYDSLPNPNQCHGECTGCAEAMVLNQVGNRVTGRVLDLRVDAHRLYAWATFNDPWDGAMYFDEATHALSGQDTGSSGLAAAKASVANGYATGYEHEFGGGEGVLQNIHEGRALSVGTWWYGDMFEASGGTFAGLPIFRPTGGRVGGHQYVARAHDVGRRLVGCRTWWGGVRDFWVTEDDFDSLLRDGGDAHFTRSV
jgi:hypothetical protein